MQIRCGQRLEGKRALICKGDEATVSRITTGRHKGLVERLQRFSQANSLREFKFRLNYPFNICDYGSGQFPYYLFKFLAIGYARSILPKNFVPIHQLRFFQEGQHRYAVMYSDHVPDKTGIIQRRSKSMDRFYATDCTKEADALRDAADQHELSINPALQPAIETANKFGIEIAHPEANYHSTEEGNPVFFEINELFLKQCVDHMLCAKDPKKEQAKRFLALICSAAIKLHYLSRFNKGLYDENTLSFREITLKQLYNAVCSIFSNEYASKQLIEAGVTEAIKYGARYWVDHVRLAQPLSNGLPLPCKIERQFHQFFNFGSGPLSEFSNI
jgi:hypothetical protein